MRGALTRRGRVPVVAALTTATAMLVGAAGLVAGGGQARAAGGAVVLDEGAFDLTPRPADGRIELRLDDRSGASTVVREPSEVVVHAVQSTLQFTPSPLAMALGTTDLDTWQLNGWEGRNLFAAEPGWNGSAAGGDTEVELSAYEGPGDFGLATYTRAMDDADAAPTVHLGSAEQVPRAFTLPGDAQRLLPTWQFTEEGVYRLTFTVTSGGSTDTETLAVVVGDDVDPGEVLPGDGSTPPPGTSTPGTPPGTTSPPAPAGPAHVIDNGHLDLAARPVDGDLQFQVKEGNSQTYEWYEPDKVVLHVKPGARRKVTAGYEFLGAVGDPVWWLPMQQVDGLVWPGWSTEGYAKSDVDGDLTYRLDAVRGPGSVAVFNSGSLGSADVALNSGDGLPDSLAHAAHAHSHWNWTFTAEGVYRTTFTVSATLADGTKVSDSETIAWVVGDETDPSTVTPGPGDAPAATPTHSSSPSASASASASVTAPSPVTAGPSVTDAGASSSDAPAVNSVASGGGSPSGGGLAATGAGVAVIAGIAVVALLAGCGAVFAVRRRRGAR
ncbi:choice-of-anchor M domain-containing protein [Streptomyces sp. NPDC052225]|uniref:choice-of-anchor M domain-containing protein n=1 Tax=Streptomyces sp. NPDC052225 TaxID=3154949 RepID=UPI003413AA9B